MYLDPQHLEFFTRKIKISKNLHESTFDNSTDQKKLPMFKTKNERREQGFQRPEFFKADRGDTPKLCFSLLNISKLAFLTLF